MTISLGEALGLVKVVGELHIDDTDAKKTQAAVDAQVEDWKVKRAEIMRDISEVAQGISLVSRSLRLVAQATGQALDPMQNALLGLLGSTTSLILGTAAAITAGSLGILTGVGLALSAFALGMQTTQTARILEDFGVFKAILDAVQGRLAAVEEGSRFRAQMGAV